MPGVADTAVGEPGTASGVSAGLVAAALVPTAFVAVTLNVYAVPLVNPLITHVVAVAGAGVQVAPDGERVTV